LFLLMYLALSMPKNGTKNNPKSATGTDLGPATSAIASISESKYGAAKELLLYLR